jgi:hypothetical protein
LEGFKDVVKKGWRVKICDKDPWIAIKENMQTCRGMIKKWVRKNTKNTKLVIQSKTKKLEEIQSLHGASNLEEEKALKSELHSLLEQEDLKWQQRAKVEWLRNKDRNTKFFHVCANQCMRRNSIGNILDANGTSCTQPEDVERAFVGYFQTLFTSYNPTAIEECTMGIERKISREMNEKLLADFLVMELKAALDQMDPLKASGLDGFSAEFFQQNWEMVGLEACSVVLKFLNNASVYGGVV